MVMADINVRRSARPGCPDIRAGGRDDRARADSMRSRGGWCTEMQERTSMMWAGVVAARRVWEGGR